MRLNPWNVILPLLLAIVLIAVAALDATAPAVPASLASCSDADAAVTNDLLGSATKQYVAILADEPGSSCATDGMQQVAAGLCAHADKLAGPNTDWPSPEASERARSLYTAVLAVDAGHVSKHCAVKGLASMRGEQTAATSSSQGQSP